MTEIFAMSVGFLNGRKAVDLNEIFIDGLHVKEEDLIGEEGKGFRYLLHSLNPERILVGVEAIGIGQQQH